jgi:hypothetical protein
MLLAQPLHARHIALDANGVPLVEVVGFERATRAARGHPTAVCLIGVDASGEVRILARCGRGAVAAEPECRRAVEAWRRAHGAPKDSPSVAEEPLGNGGNGAAVPMPPAGELRPRRRATVVPASRDDVEAARRVLLAALGDGQAHDSRAVLRAMLVHVRTSMASKLRRAAGVLVTRGGAGGRQTVWRLPSAQTSIAEVAGE